MARFPLKSLSSASSRSLRLGLALGGFLLGSGQGKSFADWNLVWHDEFDGSSINRAVWTFEIGNGANGWGNRELEYYTSRLQNAYVKDGLLHIVARNESYDGFSYTSARLKTQGLFTKKYGRIEFRAKLPPGGGFWPALWLMGADFPSVPWPACGEIDLVENKGGELGLVQGTIHYGSVSAPRYGTRIYRLPQGGSVTDFHNYMIEWTTNAISWYVDGQRYETQTGWWSSAGPYPAPFDHPFFLVMNLAVGGDYLLNPSIDSINASTTFPGEMQIDYLRIYDQTAPLQISVSARNDLLLLSWPTNIICHLQVRANSGGAGVADNWSDVPGAASPFQVFPAQTSAFYRLASP